MLIKRHANLIPCSRLLLLPPHSNHDASAFFYSLTLIVPLIAIRKDGITIEDSLEAPNPSLVRWDLPPLLSYLAQP
jgi:hypothetical protein